MKALLATLLLIGPCVQYVPKEGDVLLRIRNFETIQEKYIEYDGRLPRATRGKKVPKVAGFTLLGREICEVWIIPRGLRTTTLLDELKHCDLGDYHYY